MPVSNDIIKLYRENQGIGPLKVPIADPPAQDAIEEHRLDWARPLPPQPPAPPPEGKRRPGRPPGSKNKTARASATAIVVFTLEDQTKILMAEATKRGVHDPKLIQLKDGTIAFHDGRQPELIKALKALKSI